MEIITLSVDNIDREHICCAISHKKVDTCEASKKEWLKERFEDGLVFKKLDVRGKVFIEYIPGEKAWCPIICENYMFINCLWVSGQFKGQGYSNLLLNECIKDAKEKCKAGLVVLSSKKKMPFLSDPKYLKYKGFKVCDEASPAFELMYLPFSEDAAVPKFKECSKNGTIPEKGLVLYYSQQCPHTAKYAPKIKEVAESRGKAAKLIKLQTAAQAQNAPTPFTTYSLFYDGEFVTNEILSEAKFSKFLDERLKL